jgi:hypothetical protein
MRVMDSMKEASQSFVIMMELIEKAGKVIAEITGAEAGARAYRRAKSTPRMEMERSSAREGSLALDIPGQPIELELYPSDEEGKGYMRVNPTVAVSFNETAEGGIDSLTLYLPDGSTFTRPRIDDSDR